MFKVIICEKIKGEVKKISEKETITLSEAHKEIDNISNGANKGKGIFARLQCKTAFNNFLTIRDIEIK